jgi:uncharacterized protein
MTAPRAREGFVDALRGFALLGIVVVNVPFLALSPEGFTAASVAAPLDRAAAFVTVAFAQAKFYLLFAFLFGYSLSFLLDRDDAAQRSRFRRRLLSLGLLGALHAVFAFVGDILLLYALIGTSLLWMVRWRDAALLRFAVGLLLAWWALFGALAWAIGSDAMLGESTGGAGAASTPAFGPLGAALATGDFFDAAVARLHAWPEAFGFIAIANGMAVWAMFAVGLVAGRRRCFADVDAHRTRWRRLAAGGWLLGLPPALWSAAVSVGGDRLAAEDPAALVAVVVGFATAPFLSAGYVASLVLLQHRWPDALAVFQPAGRMSLTGYLGESIVLSLVFCGYGLALFGQVGAGTAMAIGFATWLALDLFSKAWLARFPQGPFERLLKRFSG